MAASVAARASRGAATPQASNPRDRDGTSSRRRKGEASDTGPLIGRFPGQVTYKVWAAHDHGLFIGPTAAQTGAHNSCVALMSQANGSHGACAAVFGLARNAVRKTNNRPSAGRTPNPSGPSSCEAAVIAPLGRRPQILKRSVICSPWLSSIRTFSAESAAERLKAPLAFARSLERRQQGWQGQGDCQADALWRGKFLGECKRRQTAE